MYTQVDANALEWRTIVLLSNDPVGIEELNTPGLDVHTNNQNDLLLPSRLIAKIFLFRTIYRGSGWAFAKDAAFRHVSDDPDFWEQKNAAFYKKYLGIDKIHKLWFNTVAERKEIVSPFGRRWKIDLVEKADRFGNKSTVVPVTVAANYPVQGTGNDLMCLARISAKRRFAPYPDIKLVSTVHDSIVADHPDEHAKLVSNTFFEVFRDLPKNMLNIFGVKSPIPFTCEVKQGHNLLEMTKVEYN
ncbi:DNA polymerase [Microcystis sp. M42BS1]|uniref:DNA polymerase n=1 Tax=Microcystis sp. M42BS1 TaxID=2771192 RepID=UPI00258D55A3|nr:DNA polymerase [Microcystis sp. M42BS1]MCA2570662.1 hypothetical protein [Microcystis sp. M42BS1]